MILSRKLVMNIASILIVATIIAGIGLFAVAEKADGKTIASNGIYGYLNKPSSIEFDNSGNMYIVNNNNSSITKVATNGSLTVVNSGGVYGGGKEQGVNVIQWTANYVDNQKWFLEDVKK